jgi:large subunit ribosomal protein L22
MEYKAVQKYIRMSPRKLRLVVGMVNKLEPLQAVEVLPHVGKKAALPLMKVVNTAIANARKLGANDTDLIFKEIQINQGPQLKRWRAGARGRAKPYQKYTSHIRVVLVQKEIKNTKEVKSDEGKKKTGKPQKSNDKSQVKTKIKSKAKKA